MVAWLLEQKHEVHTYQINWPGNVTPLNVEPKNLWVDQGHESNGAAAYGFFVGILGMITAWRMRTAQRVRQMHVTRPIKRCADRHEQPLKSLTALAILLFLAILFTLSALIFVFVVTYKTTGQYIREPVASNTVGINYPEFHWTPETWFKAVLDLPLADESVRSEMEDRITNMVAWRWMLLVILVVDIVGFGVTMMAWLKQRRGVAARTDSVHPTEK